MRSPRSLLTGALGLAVISISAAAEAACFGDCDRDGTVTQFEVSIGVNIALEMEPLVACPGLEGDDLKVDITELVAATMNAVDTCPLEPTATAPVMATATPTPSQPSEDGTPTPTATLGPMTFFCDLPGSVQTTGPGTVVIPGGPPNAPNLTWMELPIGFCVHYFANIGNTRQLRFSPSGDLFVASPTGLTTGGGPRGQQAIVILPDDDGDGLADTTITFLNQLPFTQGMFFTEGWFYYQNNATILRRPYAVGDRAATDPAQVVTTVNIYQSILHWPKAMDIADDGTIYVANGGDQTERCDASRPFHGGILELDGTPGGRPVSKGYRNPISVRCSRGDNKCFAIELARDYTAGEGGREKLVLIRDGDDLGFPCCATRDIPHVDVRPIPDCSAVVAENASFVIGGTPFDLDFETGRWPEPWTNRIFVPMHGVYGSWEGARVVAFDRDAMNGDVLPGSDLSGSSSGSMSDFALGWGDGLKRHGRPGTVAFAPDGRLFLGNDNDGNIVWIAPLGLPIE